MDPQPATNPAFMEFAAALRQAAEELKKAAKTAAASLHQPQMDFGRVRRHLESMADCAEDEKILLAYLKHNTLTDAKSHPRNLARVRAGKVTSERKAAAAIENGRKGGVSKSSLKQAAARDNGKRGGRPRKKVERKSSEIGPATETQLSLPESPKPPMTFMTMQDIPFSKW